jgi:endonuclease/exonuclease/phosphatase family metal-dependent hydrolase
MMREESFSVANFNIHAGIDGWGRRFDAVGVCEAIDTDVLVIEEDWIADGTDESIAREVAARKGYEIITAPLGRGRRRMPPPDASHVSKRWAPPRLSRHPRPIRLDAGVQALRSRSTSSERAIPATSGVWATTLLTRLPLLEKRLVPLPVLNADPARHHAIVATLDLGGGDHVSVIGVHLGHLTHGSTRQMKVLHELSTTMSGLVLLIGDLNCWGPPLRVFLRGMHDSVSGPTWPSWRPHSRIDHILTNDRSRLRSSRVLDASGSDHLPITATFAMRPI